MTHFFISYTGADRAWAEWIAWTLESAGHTTTIQAWDFRPGGNFVVEMQRAAAGSDRTIAVLSPDYLRSLYAMAEWAAAFAADPDGAQRKLVPVLVRDATLEGLLAPIIYIKLVGLEEAAAREALINGLSIGRAKPSSAPNFPGVRPFRDPSMAPPFPPKQAENTSAAGQAEIASRYKPFEELSSTDQSSGSEGEAERRGIFDLRASAGLFIGVSSFEDERLSAVPFAVDDAVDLAYLFALELGLVLPERTVLLLAGEPRKPGSIKRMEQLIKCGARRQSARMPNIYRHLGELTRSTEEHGLFVLTVATHGVSDQGGDFLVAMDSLRERLLRTGVAVAEVFDEIARAGAGRRLVLLDACRERLSDETRGDERATMAQSFAEAIAGAKGSVVLSGATLGGFAYDDMARQNGVFSAAVLDGLHGEAPAGAEGWITVRTLADFVQQRVVAWVRRNRPDHAAKSLGIARRIEATAEALPLAPHPEATRERQQYRARREAALAQVKENQGRILSGALWDQVASRLPEERSSPESERLLKEIEALDGSERAQRSLRDFLRELSSEERLSFAPKTNPKTTEEQANAPIRIGIEKILSSISPVPLYETDNQLEKKRRRLDFFDNLLLLLSLPLIGISSYLYFQYAPLENSIRYEYREQGNMACAGFFQQYSKRKWLEERIPAKGCTSENLAKLTVTKRTNQWIYLEADRVSPSLRVNSYFIRIPTGLSGWAQMRESEHKPWKNHHPVVLVEGRHGIK